MSELKTHLHLTKENELQGFYRKSEADAKIEKLEAELKEAKYLLNTPDTIEKCLAVEEFLKG